MNKMLAKNKGFTLIEIIIVIAIFGFILAQLNKLYNFILQRGQIKNQAEQIVPIAKTALNYIQVNYVSIYKQSATNPIIIPWTTLSSAGYAPTGISTNLRGETPCLLIMQKNNKLISMLYFVKTSNKAKAHDVEQSRTVAREIGAAGGVFFNGTSVGGTFNTWQFNDINLLNAASCGGSSVQANSIVVNLSFMGDFNQNTKSDDTVRRIQDTEQSLGNKENYNTVSTDISLHHLGGAGTAESYHKIMLNLGTGMALGSDANHTNGIVLQNGSFTANTVIPAGNQSNVSTVIKPGAVCSASSLGAWASQNNTADYAAQTAASQLQCSYNQYACIGTDPNGATRSGYCYLPITNNKVTIANGGADVNCPSGYTVAADVSPTGSNCSCAGGTQIGASYFTYDAYMVNGMQIRLAAHGYCTCKVGPKPPTSARATIPLLQCTNSTPTVTYAK